MDARSSPSTPSSPRRCCVRATTRRTWAGVDSKWRFSGRAGNYERHRPGYPAEVLTFIEAAFGLSKTSVVADVGSGTGLLSGPFLENGYRVFGVEPNREMREAAERRPGSCPCFRSVAV